MNDGIDDEQAKAGNDAFAVLFVFLTCPIWLVGWAQIVQFISEKT